MNHSNKPIVGLDGQVQAVGGGLQDFPFVKFVKEDKPLLPGQRRSVLVHFAKSRHASSTGNYGQLRISSVSVRFEGDAPKHSGVELKEISVDELVAYFEDGTIDAKNVRIHYNNSGEFEGRYGVGAFALGPGKQVRTIMTKEERDLLISKLSALGVEFTGEKQ